MHVYSVWRLPKIAAAESAYTRAMSACSEEEHRLGESSALSVPGLALDHPMPHLSASKQIHVRKRNSKPSLAHLDPGLEPSHRNSTKHAERINFSWPRNFTPLSCATVKAIQYNVCKDMDTPLDDPFIISPSEPSSAATSAQDTPIKTSNLSADNSRDSFESPHPPSPTPSYRSVQPTAASRAQAAYLAHLTAIRIQLTTHLHHLLDLKQSTITEQEERIRRHSGSTMDAKTTTRLSQSRSFWSFKDEEAEKKEKMARIKEGRARGWKTARFEPKRYIELAEDALAEMV